ncbi:MAG: CDP-alcohol phosphatidyltransferase family protein [Leptospirales bacterium]
MNKSWIPNSLSLGNLALGVISILWAMNAVYGQDYDNSRLFFISGLLILVAAIFDGFDGTVARWLNVETQMGEQLDSLADLVTFGLAPAILIYAMFLNSIKFDIGSFSLPLGAIITVIYPLSAAFRLARFNVEHDGDSFLGLPSPIAGTFIAIMAVINRIYMVNATVAIAIFLGLAFLMSSNIKYSKPHISLRKYFNKYRFVALVLLLTFSAFWFKWYWTTLAVLAFYIFSGFIALGLHLLQKVKLVFGRLNGRE